MEPRGFGEAVFFKSGGCSCFVSSSS
jgi:hypothetical protein